MLPKYCYQMLSESQNQKTAILIESKLKLIRFRRCFIFLNIFNGKEANKLNKKCSRICWEPTGLENQIPSHFEKPIKPCFYLFKKVAWKEFREETGNPMRSEATKWGRN